MKRARQSASRLILPDQHLPAGGQAVHHTLTVTNPADAAEELQFGIGYHPAFRIPFD